MPANVDALVKEGIAALKEGRTADADRALRKAVELNDQNEQAWLWLSAVVATPQERQICLENVLELNPNNAKARKGLDATLKEINVSGAQAAPPKPPVPDPFGSGSAWNADSAFGSSPFAGTGFESNPYAGSKTDPAATGWPGFDVPASSVEWGRNSSPAEAPARESNQPSPEEYDNWMAGLSLGGSAGQHNNVPAFESADFDPSNGPFGSTSFSDAANEDFFSSAGGNAFGDSFGIDANPFDLHNAPAAAATSATTDTANSDFGGFPSDDDDLLADDPFARLDPLPSSGPFSTAFEDEPDVQTSNMSFPTSFPMSPIVAESPSSGAFPMLSPAPALAAKQPSRSPFEGGSGSSPNRVGVPGSAPVFTTIDSTPSLSNPSLYFKQIPDEIKASGSSLPVLIISVIVLIILNIGSLLLLVANLKR